MLIYFQDNFMIITSAVLVILIIAIITLSIVLYRTRIRLQDFLIDVGANTISDSLNSLVKHRDEHTAFRKSLEEYLRSVENRLRRSIQSIHTVRYNPWKGQGFGGNQSFVTTLIDENGDGVVITSIHARDHVSMYAKPLAKHTSEYELTEEEIRAIEQAKARLENK